MRRILAQSKRALKNDYHKDTWRRFSKHSSPRFRHFARSRRRCGPHAGTLCASRNVQALSRGRSRESLNERAQSTGAEQITQALAQSSQTAPQIVETLAAVEPGRYRLALSFQVGGVTRMISVSVTFYVMIMLNGRTSEGNK
jgi:hypothetical protein